MNEMKEMLENETHGYFRFSKNVEEALREICLAEIVESTIIMCLLEYYCMMVNNSINVSLFSIVMKRCYSQYILGMAK